MNRFEFLPRIQELPHSRVPFEVDDPHISKLMWTHPDYDRHEFRGYLNTGQLSLSSFIGVNPSSDNKILLEAERYATGALGHGGGVRVGNLGDIQVKGIGPNALEGPNSPAWYRYGKLTLIDGALECVIGTILNALRPGFCTDVLMLLATSDQGGRYCQNITKEKLASYTLDQFDIGWGGVLIRRPVLRPAHFLRSDYFTRDITAKRGIVADHIRVRDIWLKVKECFNTPENVIAWILEYGEKAMDLQAFAKSYGILHGGMTSSNMTMLGTWLDLNQIQYESDGVKANVSHENEKNVVILTVRELLHCFSKYNLIPIDIDPIIRHLETVYERNLNEYVKSLQLLGGPATKMLEFNDGCDFKSQYLEELRSIGLCRPASHKNMEKKMHIIKVLNLLKKRCVIECLKLGEIRLYFEDVLFKNALDDLMDAIHRYTDFVDWLLENKERQCRIYKSRHMEEVWYCSESECYVYVDEDSQILYFHAIKDLVCNLKTDYNRSISSKFIEALISLEAETLSQSR